MKTMDTKFCQKRNILIYYICRKNQQLPKYCVRKMYFFIFLQLNPTSSVLCSTRVDFLSIHGPVVL